MIQYPKIESLFKRDKETFKFIEGSYKLPEFAYLSRCEWLLTEKVNGTNVRVMWDGADRVRLAGRTETAQIPTFLVNELLERFPAKVFQEKYDAPMCLYGEGFGAKIQKGGGNYIPDGVNFILFDVRIEEWWLKWKDILDIASKLGIEVVPMIEEFGLPMHDAVELVKRGMKSHWGDFEAEGIVLRPLVDLKTRAGHRIIAKIKGKDFAKE